MVHLLEATLLILNIHLFPDQWHGAQHSLATPAHQPCDHQLPSLPLSKDTCSFGVPGVFFSTCDGFVGHKSGKSQGVSRQGKSHTMCREQEVKCKGIRRPQQIMKFHPWGASYSQLVQEERMEFTQHLFCTRDFSLQCEFLQGISFLCCKTKL